MSASRYQCPLLSHAATSSHAVVFPWTTAALHDLISCLDLRSHGMNAKCRVALYLPNGPLAATVLLAAMVNYCAVPLDPQEPVAALAARLVSSRARCLLTVREFLDVAQAAATSASLPLVVLEPAPLMPPGGFIVPRPLTVIAAGEFTPSLHNAPDDVVLLLHTSGTTGEPRCVRHTLRALLVSARALAESLALSSEDLGLNMMPMHHIGGITCNLLAPLFAGSRMLFLPRFDPHEWWRLLYLHEATWCYAVPAMWRAILCARSTAAVTLPQCNLSLRLIRSGAAALSQCARLPRPIDL